MSFLKNVSTDTRSFLGRFRYLNNTPNRTFAKKHAPAPTCGNKGGGKKKSKDDCTNDHPKPRSMKNIRETFPFYDLIKFNKLCCDTDCHDKDFPSFDECLYEESDKNKRKYQVTWTECPPMAIKPKKICCFEKARKPPIVRRKKKPSTACKIEKCPEKDTGSCPRLAVLPRCRPVRVPVRCHRVRTPTDCTKIKAPYPAFSECAKPRLRVKRRGECECLDEIAMCEVFRQLQKRLQRGALNLNPCQKK